MRTIRWGDLINPREAYLFTLADAWGALPTLLAMAGFFLGAVLVLYLVKKALEYIFLRKERFKKYVLEQTKDKDAMGRIIKVWRKMPTTHYGSIMHLILETLFFMGLVIAALFAAAVGDVNIWQSPIASVGIGLIGTYIFGPGLQQVGSGYFFFLTNAMAVDEYWILIGGSIEGRVSRITPFFVELLSIDVNGHGRLHRVAMTTAMAANWERSFYKESHEARVVMDGVTAPEPPIHMGASNQLLLEDMEVEEDEPILKKFR